MKLDVYCEELKKCFGDNLKSIILYGSAVTKEFVENYSDYNLLLVLQNVVPAEMLKISKMTKKWVRSGNPVPLMFTVEEIKASLDVFPIEFTDIQSNHKILYGEDILSGIEIGQNNLRHEIEHELKSKLLRLRESYVLMSDKRKEVDRLLIKSFSSFSALFKAVLRLTGIVPPGSKMEMISLISQKLGLNEDVFKQILKMKEDFKYAKSIDIDKLAEEYLQELQKVVNYTDKYS